MKMRTVFPISCLVTLGFACSFSQVDPRVTITVESPKSTAINYQEELFSQSLPSSVNGFDCYFANAFGSGIPADSNGGGFGYSSSNGSTTPTGCSYEGVPSNLASTNQNISFKVPAGPSRTIQMIGVSTGGQGCFGYTTFDQLNQYFFSLNSPNCTTNCQNVQPILLGFATVNLFNNSTVTIQNIYSGQSLSPGGYCAGIPMIISISPTTPITHATCVALNIVATDVNGNPATINFSNGNVQVNASANVLSSSAGCGSPSNQVTLSTPTQFWFQDNTAGDSVILGVNVQGGPPCNGSTCTPPPAPAPSATIAVQ